MNTNIPHKVKTNIPHELKPDIAHVLKTNIQHELETRWPEAGAIPVYAKISYPPRRKDTNLHNTSTQLQPHTLTNYKKQGVIQVKFKKKIYKKTNKNIKYVKVVRNTRPYRRNSDDYWFDWREKAKTKKDSEETCDKRQEMKRKRYIRNAEDKKKEERILNNC